MRRFGLVFLSVLAGLGPAGCSSDDSAPAKTDSDRLHSGFVALSLDDALAKASAEGKVVMVDFYATWCVPCKKLDAETFPRPEMVQWLQAHAVAIKVDFDRDPALARRFGIRAIPVNLFLQPDGRELGRIEGFYPARDFIRMADAILAQKK